MMKKITPCLLLMAVASFIAAFGQKPFIELSFTAASNGQYVPLDSFYIENLTQIGDTVIYFPDTVFTLNYSTEITDHGITSHDGFRLSQNHPNPFRDQTAFSIFLPDEGNVCFTIQNLMGAELGRYEYYLPQGHHSFTLFAGKEQIYLLTASALNKTSTIKLAGTKSGKAFPCSLVYNGNTGGSQQVLPLKTGKSINYFNFSYGDKLRFIGYAITAGLTNGSDVMEDSVKMNKAYLFQIAEGLPCPDAPAVEYGDQTYQTVQIGSQCWFKENLNVGTWLYGTANQTNNGIIEKYCYNNFYPNCITYGALYQWDEAMQYIYQPGTQGICPSGWHLPTDEEWCTLAYFLDATVNCQDYGWTGTDAGGRMKETGTLHWISPNAGATNSSGFTALPAGNRDEAGGFVYIGESVSMWSTTESTANTSWYWVLNTNAANIWRFFYSKQFGYSVRCLRN